MDLRTVALAFVLSLSAATSYSTTAQPVAPTRLVVMIEGSTPSGASVKGAGLIVGRLATGEVLIATAKHVTHSIIGLNKLSFRFFDVPGILFPGKVLPDHFGRDLDLAVVAVEATQVARGLGSLDRIPVGRLEEPVKLEERVSLIGQMEGMKWNATSRSQMVTGDQGNNIRINSPEAGPGVSGGVAIDSSDRIVGIALNDDRYVITLLKLSVVATQLRSAGLPFAIVHGETKIMSPLDYEAGLRAAIRSTDGHAVARFAADASAVQVVNVLLDEQETAKAFASNVRGLPALAWLGRLIASGLDPNRIVVWEGRKRPLLRAAIAQNNVALAVALLEAGATPYMYEDLLGQEYRTPYFLFPLEVLNQLSASHQEKLDLVRSMVTAGLTLTDLEILDRYYASSQMKDVHLTQREVISRYDITIPTQNDLTDRGSKTICRRASTNDYDWCELIARLPSQLVEKSGGWHKQFSEVKLVKPLAVVDNHLYVMTFSRYAGDAPAGYGLMKISKDADQMTWYRFSNSGAGLGHCEQLREIVNWKPDWSYQQCWRRQTLNRGQSRGTYTAQKYESVIYESVDR